MKSPLEIKLELLSILEIGIKSIFNKKTVITSDTLKYMTENYTKTLEGATKLLNAKMVTQLFKDRINEDKKEAVNGSNGVRPDL